MRTKLVNGSNILPSDGFPDGGEFGAHTYLLEKIGVIRRRVDKLMILDEVVCLHLPGSLQIKVWIIVAFLHWLLLLFFFRWHHFFVFMHRALFGLGVACA